MYSRKEWIQRSHFHPHSDREVLDEVLRRVKGAEGIPVVLLDLDSTLYEVQPRSFQIIQQWLQERESFTFPKFRERIEKIKPSQMGYSLHDTLGHAGIALDSHEMELGLKVLKGFWRRWFFSNDYIHHDHPYPGAVRYVTELYDRGAHIIYLTGRDDPQMGQGTRAKLKADRFPFEQDRTRLILKPTRELDDFVYKIEAAVSVKDHGELIASFENEPKNLVGIQNAFPDAMHILMDTVCSDQLAPVGKNLYRIRSYQW